MPARKGIEWSVWMPRRWEDDSFGCWVTFLLVRLHGGPVKLANLFERGAGPASANPQTGCRFARHRPAGSLGSGDRIGMAGIPRNRTIHGLDQPLVRNDIDRSCGLPTVRAPQWRASRASLTYLKST